MSLWSVWLAVTFSIREPKRYCSEMIEAEDEGEARRLAIRRTRQANPSALAIEVTRTQRN